MTKKVILGISILINLVLAYFLIQGVIDAREELKFEYVEQETLRPDSLRMYLERENYGVAASLSHPIRGGAEIDELDEDYYLLGEYADTLFLKAIFEKSGDTATATACDQRLAEIREKMPAYSELLDKIEESVKKTIRE
ncbi:MAG: hypothetical protein IKS10_04075 [Lachnospiraceae bacterium]|nr:hypothetical protein [Lachnospiraceae bacterium]